MQYDEWGNRLSRTLLNTQHLLDTGVGHAICCLHIVVVFMTIVNCDDNEEESSPVGRRRRGRRPGGRSSRENKDYNQASNSQRTARADGK